MSTFGRQRFAGESVGSGHENPSVCELDLLGNPSAVTVREADREPAICSVGKQRDEYRLGDVDGREPPLVRTAGGTKNADRVPDVAVSGGSMAGPDDEDDKDDWQGEPGGGIQEVPAPTWPAYRPRTENHERPPVIHPDNGD
jgi:hypothetical protein